MGSMRLTWKEENSWKQKFFEKILFFLFQGWKRFRIVRKLLMGTRCPDEVCLSLLDSTKTFINQNGLPSSLFYWKENKRSLFRKCHLEKQKMKFQCLEIVNDVETLWVLKIWKLSGLFREHMVIMIIIIMIIFFEIRNKS